MRNEDQTGYDLETLSTAKIYSNIKYNNFSVDYGVTTDSGNATMMQNDGKRVEVTPTTSYEYVGDSCIEGEPAKIIYAKNGDIYLDAPAGNIILRAKNIRIVAEDGSGEITMNSGKIIDFKAPSIKENGTNITVVAPGNSETIVGTKSGSAQVQNQDGSSTDLLQGSFLGSILSGLQNLKKFFEDCGVG